MPKKLETISDKELFAYEQKVREAMLGQDEETRRLLRKLHAVVTDEKKRRANLTKSTTESKK